MAVMGGRTDLVELLLSKGANIGHCDRDGHSAVHWAVVCGQVSSSIIKKTSQRTRSVWSLELRLLKRQMYIVEKDLLEFQLETLAYLLSQGADVEAPDILVCL